MNRLLLFISIVSFVLSPALCRQAPTTPKQEEAASTKVIIQLRYVKLEPPGRSTDTCIAVFSDGRFHLEQAWQGSFPDSGLLIFEGTLAADSLKSLSTVLATEEFRKLRTPDTREWTDQGEVIWAIVPRSEETQAFLLVGREGTAYHASKLLPSSIRPLIDWIKETRKGIDKRKSFLVKGAKPVNCWLAKSWPTTPAQQDQAHAADGVANEEKRSEAPSTPYDPGTNGQQRPGAVDEKKLYSSVVTFVEYSATDVLEAIPELRGLEPAPDQDELPVLLERVGDRAVGLLLKMPNLICHEKVIETRQGRKFGAREFDYLILAHHTSEAVSLEEYRVDLRDKLLAAPDSRVSASLSDLRRKSDEASARNSGGLPLSEGFAYKWVHFYPSNRSESNFRYLGRQRIDGHKTFVLAFAQKPGSVRSPGELRFHGRLIPILYQGIAWVDESDSRIVRLRTDLLAPLVDVHLRRLTAEIHFGSVRLEDGGSPLWLPHEVQVTSDVNGQIFEERHVYSAYRAYSVQSKIVLTP